MRVRDDQRALEAPGLSAGDGQEKNLPEEEEVVVAEVLAGGIRRTEDHIQYLRHECYSLPVDRFLQI